MVNNVDNNQYILRWSYTLSNIFLPDRTKLRSRFGRESSLTKSNSESTVVYTLCGNNIHGDSFFFQRLIYTVFRQNSEFYK